MSDSLQSFAEAIANRNRAAPVPRAPVAISLQEHDEEELAGRELGEAEGQSFVIEYVDGSGTPSTRRITVWAIREGAGGVPVLDGMCHERKAERNFRIDRIRACIDYDGTVHADVPAFLAETFGMDMDVARMANEGEAAAAPARERDGADWPRVRQLIKPHATILSALSMSDGAMSDNEVRVAVEHCSTVVGIQDEDFSPELIARIAAYIRRLRPTRASLLKACEQISKIDPAEITDLLISALALIDADGVRDPEERALLDQLSMALVGSKMT